MEDETEGNDLVFELIDKFCKVMEDNLHLQSSILPALSTLLTATVAHHISSEVPIEVRDKYYYVSLGLIEGSKRSVVCVDFDTTPLLEELELENTNSLSLDSIISVLKDYTEATTNTTLH